MIEKLKWIILCIILVISPIFKGLFFYSDMVVFIPVLSLLIGTDIIFARHKLSSWKVSLPLISLLVMIGTYSLTILLGSSVSVGDTIFEITKLLFITILFIWIKMRFISDELPTLLKIVVFGTTLSSIIGVIAVTGLINLPDAFLDTRFTGTFEYANAFAAYLLVGTTLTAFLYTKQTNIKGKLIFSAAGFSQFIILIFTYSRGAWLLLPVAVLLSIFILKAHSRIQYLLYIVGQIVITALLSKAFYTANMENLAMKPKTLGIFVLGVFLILIYTVIVHKVFSKVFNENLNLNLRVLLPISVVIVVMAGLIVTLEQPLIEDLTGNENIVKNSVTRVIDKVVSGENYTVSFDVSIPTSAKTPLIESPNKPWGISIQSIDMQGVSKNIPLDYDFANSGSFNLHFKTFEDTEQLKFTFAVGYPNQKVSLSNVKLISESGDNARIKVSYRFIPEFIISRINSISLNEKVSVGSRLVTYKDMFSIFKSQPLIGSGSNAWDALYPQYQSELYYTAIIHNYPAQLLVELGVLGGLAFVFIILTLIYSLFYYRKQNDLCAGISLSALLLLGHSIIDFDMAFLSLLMLLWILLGIMPLPNKLTFGRDFDKKSVSLTFALLIILLIPLASNFSFAIADEEYSTAVAFKSAQDFDSAILHYRKATQFNPFKVSYRYELADMLHAKTSSTGDTSFSEESKTVLEKAYKYAPFDMNVLKFMIDNNIILGDFDRAIALSDELIKAAPLRQDPYDIQVNACLTMGEFFFDRGDLKKSATYYRYPEKGVYERLSKNRDSQVKTLFSKSYMNIMQKMELVYLSIEEPDKLLNLPSLQFVSLFFFDVNYDDIPDDWTLSGNRLTIAANLKPNQYYEIQIPTEIESSEITDMLSIISASGSESEITIENQLTNHGTFIYSIKTSESYHPENHKFSIPYEHLDSIKSFELYSIQ